MHEECDEGFTNRMPGSCGKITRKPLTALGPNHQISAEVLSCSRYAKVVVVLGCDDCQKMNVHFSIRISLTSSRC